MLCLCSTAFSQVVRNLDEAKVVATKERKLILAHFWFVGCGPCRVQDVRIFSNPQYSSILHKEFVFVKIDTVQYPDLKNAYGITGAPTEMLMLPKGKEISRFTGPTDPLKYINEALLHKSEFKHSLLKK